MNYRDYKEIMEAEGLQESELVRVFLREAMRQQRFLKGLSYHGALGLPPAKRVGERKITAILDAIDMARHEKELGYRIVEDGEKEIQKYMDSL